MIAFAAGFLCGVLARRAGLLCCCCHRPTRHGIRSGRLSIRLCPTCSTRCRTEITH